LYRQQQESNDYGSNDAVLAQISRMTGGRFDTTPDAVFNTNGRYIYSSWRLWPALLALAIALTITELILRKWRGIVQAFRRA
jgi:hypothetical protein